MYRIYLTCLLFALTMLGRSLHAGTVVRFETSLGSFDVGLFDDTAPNTVTNFLSYVRDGDYAGSIVHRSVPGFVIQGGGYYTDFSPVPVESPVANEFGASNVRGTLAMAKLSGNPDSADSQWFINLSDNGFLDQQNGGYTVFGEVLDDGMNVVDAIAALDRDASDVDGLAFTQLPVLDISLPPDQQRQPDNLVVVNRLSLVPEPSALSLVVWSLWLPIRGRVGR